MATGVTITCTVLLIFLAYISTVAGFVKMAAVASKVDIVSKVDYIVISHVLHDVESFSNQTIHVNMEFKRPIKEMKLNAAYYNMAENGTVQHLIIKRSADVCFFMRNPGSDRLVKLLFDYLKKHSNIPMRCPIPSGSYYMRGRVSDVPVPAFLPETNYKLEIIYRSEVRRETLLEIRVYGRLVRLVGSVFSVIDF